MSNPDVNHILDKPQQKNCIHHSRYWFTRSRSNRWRTRHWSSFAMSLGCGNLSSRVWKHCSASLVNHNHNGFPSNLGTVFGRYHLVEGKV